MSGDPESQTLAEKRVEEKRTQIQNYEKRLGLPVLRSNKDECEALNLSGEDISKLTPEQRDEYSGDLASYAIYIQRTLAKEKGMARWLEARINLTVAPELNDYTGYYSHDQRRAIAIKGNAYAKELEEIRMTTQLKVDILEGLTYQIN